MTRRTIWLAILLLVIAVSGFSLPPLSQGETTVTGAGGAAFPAGAIFNAVSLSSMSFGMGVVIPGDGTANGTFESTLVGTSATGIARNIVVVGEPTTGSGQANGAATYAGTCTVDPGDGTQTLTGVPFTLTVAKLPDGKQGLTLILGATSLPAASVNTGSVTVK